MDGWVLPRLPVAVYAAGETQKVAFLIGNNGRERSFSGDRAALTRAIQNRYGDLAPAALKLYGLTDDTHAESYPPYGNAGAQFATDSSFRCSEVAIADWFSAAGSPVYQYEFTYARSPAGATHSAEVPYVFGRISREGPPEAIRLSEAMQHYWTNFVKTGDPNDPDLPQWPRYTAGQRRYIEFSAEGPVLKANLRRPFCELFVQSLQKRF